MRKISKLKDLLIDYDHSNDWQYQQWKSKLPSNLKNTDTSIYNLYGAFKAGMQPELNEDGTYHLGSRDPNTGKILKKKSHPTYNKAIQSDIESGYYPIEYDGDTYTRAPIPMGDPSGWQIPEYKEGGIHIKKKNRGKFTKSAKQHGMGVQEYARKVVNDPNATTLQKRRAQFAINAKKFKH